MLLPRYLIEFGRESDEQQEWVDSLPYQLKRISEEWKLRLEDPITQNATCSFVLNCLTENNEAAVLKFGYPHFEAMNEINGLQLLNGTPTVQLMKFDKESNSMLLEKCIPGTNLNTLDEINQDLIICNLLKEIWETIYPENCFNQLSELVSLWNNETLQSIHLFPDPNLAKEGCELKEHLIKTTEKDVLLATDLHAGNVLKSQRKPWLVIDIKPHLGDRVYDLTQHLMNSTQRLKVNPVKTINELAKQAKVDNSRLRQWMFARLASENNGIHQKIALTLK